MRNEGIGRRKAGFFIYKGTMKGRGSGRLIWIERWMWGLEYTVGFADENFEEEKKESELRECRLWRLRFPSTDFYLVRPPAPGFVF